MKIVPYYRIRLKGPNKATTRDDIPELQQRLVRDFIQANDTEAFRLYAEVEAAKMEDRPKLRSAIKKAQDEDAKLVIADHYRIARDQLFLSILVETGVDFVCLGDSRVTPETVADLLKFEEIHREETRINTKNILAERKAGGAKLGSSRPGHWKGREHLRGSKQGAKASGKVRSNRAKAAYAPLILPKILKMRDEGKSDETIAAKLNEDGHTTTVGKPFTYVAVYRIRTRYSQAG